jgi:hypothetical protein
MLTVKTGIAAPGAAFTVAGEITKAGGAMLAGLLNVIALLTKYELPLIPIRVNTSGGT